jgi:hypothetical protein
MNDEAQNPYASPTADITLLTTGAAAGSNRELLIKCRKQIHALGGIWIFIGTVAIGLAAFLGNTAIKKGDTWTLIVLVLGGLGMVWFVLGVCTCFKQVWAIYVGLVLSYPMHRKPPMTMPARRTTATAPAG